jgi:hypothetical protein
MMVCGRQGILDAQPPRATAARPATEKIDAQARGAGRALFSKGACITINRHDRRAAEAKARHATGADRDFEKYRELLRRLMDKPDREAALACMRGETVKAASIDMMMIHPTGEAAPSPCPTI